MVCTPCLEIKRIQLIVSPIRYFFTYRHSQARILESEVNQNTSPATVPAVTAPTEGTRLRRRSSVEAPNMSLLLELNHATASNQTGEEKVKAPRLQRQSSIEDVEMNSCKLEPRIEGRIVIMTQEIMSRLQNERQKWEMSIATHTIKEEN